MAKIRLSYRQRQTLIDLHSLLLDLDADVRERTVDTQHACARALEAAHPALKAAGIQHGGRRRRRPHARGHLPWMVP